MTNINFINNISESVFKHIPKGIQYKLLTDVVIVGIFIQKQKRLQCPLRVRDVNLLYHETKPHLNKGVVIWYMPTLNKALKTIIGKYFQLIE